MGLLNGKVAVVTGGGGGLGTQFCLALAAEGASVVVNDLGVASDGSGESEHRRAQRVVDKVMKAGGQAIANFDSVDTPHGAANLMDHAVRMFGRVDILVNSAGVANRNSVLEMTDYEWAAVMRTQLDGTFHCIQAAARVMVDGNYGGRIINNTSIVGFRGNFQRANYAAAKAGVVGLTMTAALELAPHEITVNCIVPVAYTRMTRDEPMFQEEGIANKFKPEDAAPVVVFLASELSGKTTGKLIGVQGRRIFAYDYREGKGVSGSRAWTPKTILDEIDKILKV